MESSVCRGWVGGGWSSHLRKPIYIHQQMTLKGILIQFQIHTHLVHVRNRQEVTISIQLALNHFVCLMLPSHYGYRIVWQI